jgi:N-acetylglutamate synthase-like GNAT family acetyltransferase
VRYFILNTNGTPVGCVGVERATETTCYLERLAVLPQYRGSGYGSRLTQYALTQAKVMGASEVGIGIIAADSDLKAFYQTLGFEAGPTKRFAHLPFDVVFMHIFFDHGMISGGSLSARDYADG